MQDFAAAALLRDEEKRLLAERQRLITELEAGGTPDPEPPATAGAETTAGTDPIAEAGGDDEDPPAAAG